MSERQASSFRRGTFTKDAIRIAGALNRAGIFYSLEWQIPRYGEFNDRGLPLSYFVDVMIMDQRFKPVAIEVEGEGSSSKGNDKRDAYLSKMGITVMHVDNKVKSEEVIARLNASFKAEAR